MKERDYKIKNDYELKTEILRLLEKHALFKKGVYLEGKEMIIETLLEIKKIVFKEEKIKYRQEGYSNILPYCDFKGGTEFLYSKEGKEIIEIFFYFADIYKIEDDGKELHENKK